MNDQNNAPEEIFAEVDFDKQIEIVEENKTSLPIFKVTEDMKVHYGHQRGSQGRKPEYPFLSLEIGDGFIVEGKKFENVCSAASSVGRRNGRKFKIYRQLENKILVTRIA